MKTTTSVVGRLETGGGKHKHSPNIDTLRNYALACSHSLKIDFVPHGHSRSASHRTVKAHATASILCLLPLVTWIVSIKFVVPLQNQLDFMHGYRISLISRALNSRTGRMQTNLYSRMVTASITPAWYKSVHFMRDFKKGWISKTQF